ncbi:Aminopeptidase YwaD [Thalassocella blandensis]|nr:Aminopeptidase YwaD [Thalassocella blandensis]
MTLKKIALSAVLFTGILLVFSWAIVSRPIPLFSTEVDISSQKVDIKRLEQIVKMLSVDLFPRDYSAVENTHLAAQYIQTEFSKTNGITKVQTFEVDGKIYSNVIVEFGPDGAHAIIVGAHYDAVATTPGADDNASGIAGLLELARLLSTEKLSRKIILVAYALEEPPHFATSSMGSYVHAASLKNTQVELMISLEMIGYFSDEPGSQEYPIPLLQLIYPDRGNFIAIIEQLSGNKAWQVKSAINQHTSLPAYSMNAPTLIGTIAYSDHRNYWAHGYPAVMITDTAFYRNHEYHTARDTYDRLNYEAMAKVVYGVYKFITSEN